MAQVQRQVALVDARRLHLKRAPPERRRLRGVRARRRGTWMARPAQPECSVVVITDMTVHARLFCLASRVKREAEDSLNCESL
jgi:hypothetical protein